MARHNDGVTAAEELVPWLRAQLDEDERVARAATPGPWTDFGKRPYGVEQLGVPDGHMVAEIQACEDHEDRQAADAEHIARHDPARVLHEVEAKRLILVEHSYGFLGPRWCSTCDIPADYPNNRDYCLTVRALALPYAARPGFREEWRP